ncbi:class I SAM-dependent methyltransferase [Streptomyces sp. NPDC004609]|uniref:class I SAM-dependent methyltransferase n=1 Tax=Streptomyces sp. NPDC004609 TaxID=3364704 RepID=UPI0036761FBB
MEPHRPMSNFLYRNPEFYEAVFHDSGDTVPGMCRLMIERYCAPRPKTLLDIGCGTGHDVAGFDRDGLDCVGLDRQESMITYARERHPGLDFRVEDMLSVRIGRTFDVLTCLGWVLNYALTNEDVGRVMETFAAHAAPGALLVLQTLNPIGDPEGKGLRRRISVDTPAFRGSAEAHYTVDRHHQLLTRERTWHINGRPAEIDHVTLRQLFPMELRHHLSSAGFTTLGMYDNTALSDSDLGGPVLYTAARFRG